MTPGLHLTCANFFTWSLSHQPLQHEATMGQQEPHEEKISHPEHRGACECWWVWLGHNSSPPHKHHKWEEPGEKNPNKTSRPQCYVSIGVTAKGLCGHRRRRDINASAPQLTLWSPPLSKPPPTQTHPNCKQMKNKLGLKWLILVLDLFLFLFPPLKRKKKGIRL